jgi:hypothetical protein
MKHKRHASENRLSPSTGDTRINLDLAQRLPGQNVDVLSVFNLLHWRQHVTDSSKNFQARLAEANVRFAVISVGEGCSILLTEHWGKIFGPFMSDEPSTMWISPKAAMPGGIRELV